jgi:hypothetical protein
MLLMLLCRCCHVRKEDEPGEWSSSSSLSEVVPLKSGMGGEARRGKARLRLRGEIVPQAPEASATRTCPAGPACDLAGDAAKRGCRHRFPHAAADSPLRASVTTGRLRGDRDSIDNKGSSREASKSRARGVLSSLINLSTLIENIENVSVPRPGPVALQRIRTTQPIGGVCLASIRESKQGVLSVVLLR